MPEEEKIINELVNKFVYLENKIKFMRPRRIFLEVEYNNFNEVFNYIVKEMHYGHLCTITGLDEIENLGFIYHLSGDHGILLNLKISIPKANPVLKSIITFFPGAEIYERELADLLGVKIDGLPEGNRYPLTDDWPKDQFPLRKDWKPLGDNQGQGDENA